MEDLKREIQETIVKAHDAKNQSRQSLWWAVAALVISIVSGIIQIIKVLPHL